MNKAELEQEAELYSYDVPIYQVEAQLEKIQKAYLAGAEPREKRITKLEKENKKLKCFVKNLIYENHNLCFQFNNTTCLFNSDYRNRAEELIGEKL